jgi:hypothetical protein
LEAASSVGSKRIVSWRFAPSVAQPIGIPARSVSRDHFQPDLPRSTGFGPGPFTAPGSFVLGAIDGGFGQVESDDLVVGAESFLDNGGEHAGCFLLVSPGSQRGVRDGLADELLRVDP